MTTLHIFPIVGFVVLFFRLWLCEYKVKEELSYRRFYISRILSYFMCIGFIFSNRIIIFNLILVCVWPGFIGAFLVRDLNFFSKRNQLNIPQEKRIWLNIERITMHIPNIIFGIMPFFTGLKDFVVVDASNDAFYFMAFSMISSVFMISASFFLLDQRWLKKVSWPVGKYIWNTMFFTGLLMYPYIFFL